MPPGGFDSLLTKLQKDKSLGDCNKVVTDILRKTDFSVNFLNTRKTHNTRFSSSLKPK